MVSVIIRALSDWEIAGVVIQTLLFLIGLPIQLKTIYVCSKDKESKTWYIHLIHSIALIINFGFQIILQPVTKSILNLSSYTGEWICYLTLFLRIYGFYIISINSLLVSVIKYIYIVHNEKVRSIADDKLKKVFVITYLGFPFTMAMIGCMTKDILTFDEVIRCFALSDTEDDKFHAWVAKRQNHFLCPHGWTDQDIDESYYLYIVQQCVCGFRRIVISIINTNTLEAFLYYKIFRKMDRYCC